MFFLNLNTINYITPKKTVDRQKCEKFTIVINYENVDKFYLEISTNLFVSIVTQT